jgi:hypothetical protein
MTPSLPRALRPRALVLGLLLAAGAAACASADPYNPSSLARGDLGQVGHACAAVVGLDPGEAGYSACVESLSQSVSDAGPGRAVASVQPARGSWYTASPSASFSRAQSACASLGLAPGACAADLNAAIAGAENGMN